jgi:YD repeat-containing protein
MSLRELASRNDGGHVVRLMWDPARDQTVLRFRDEETDETIIVDVPKEEALTAFNNPRDYLPSGVGEAA